MASSASAEEQAGGDNTADKSAHLRNEECVNGDVGRDGKCIYIDREGVDQTFGSDDDSKSGEEDDGESDDDGDYDEEDEDGETQSLKSLVFDAWKQHLLAIVVAVLAAGASMYLHHNSSPRVAKSLWPNTSSSLMASPTLGTTRISSRHAHIHGYMRTGNVSFCHSTRGLPDVRDTHMQELEFFLPESLVGAMKLHYIADDREDDFYKNTHKDSVMTKPNAELYCLEQQRADIEAAAYKGIIRGKTLAYFPPTLEEMYQGTDENGVVVGNSFKQRLIQQPPLTFTGFAAKFVNLSPKPVLLMWDGKGGHADAARLVGEIAPFDSLGTATMPGQSFSVTPVYDSTDALERWTITADTALVAYEPEEPEEMHAYYRRRLQESKDDKEKSSQLEREYAKYQMQLLNMAFSRDYLIATQRHWLANFPRRFPTHPMHAAVRIGQTHRISVPTADGGSEKLLLEAVSVTPRVFVVDNFLSKKQCRHIIAQAIDQGLHPSTLHAGGEVQVKQQDDDTRRSRNAWLERDTSEITQLVYDRAAALMKVDPSVFHPRHDDDARHHSIAESLQVVHYSKGGDKYQPHHDFVYPSITHRYQPTRFATLLLYLNDVPSGGETRFPRAANANDAEGIAIQPVQGRAVLFYNMLPDGNVDDLSQHGSEPTSAEHDKWLANLWVWDPVIN